MDDRPPGVVFLRHGATQWNEELRWQGGEVDFSLSQSGRAEVAELSRRLRTYGLDESYSLVSSTMLRAVETAEVLRRSGVGSGPIRRIKELREVHVGKLSGMTEDEIREAHPVLFADWSSGKVPYYPDGESIHQLIARLTPRLIELLRQDKPLIVISHKTVLRAIRLIIGVPGPIDEGHLSGVALWTCPESSGTAVWRNLGAQDASRGGGYSDGRL